MKRSMPSAGEAIIILRDNRVAQLLSSWIHGRQCTARDPVIRAGSVGKHLLRRSVGKSGHARTTPTPSSNLDHYGPEV